MAASVDPAAAATTQDDHKLYTLERDYKFEVQGDMTALLLFSCITFFQQVGFASLESGSVRAKNTRNVLLKTLIDKLVSGIVYWAFGFAFAYGDTVAGGLIGRSYFFLGDRLGARGGAAGAVSVADGGSPDEARAAAVLALWFSSWVFLITATTIVSGCLAERARFEAYLAYTPVMAGLAFPLAVHWAFHGWLSDAPCSYIDFAGGSTVHLLGGAAGLAASLAVGPRLGRFAARKDPERGSNSHNSNELAKVEEYRPSGAAAGPSSSSSPPREGNTAAAAAGAAPAAPASPSSSVSGSSSSSSAAAAAAAPNNSSRTAASSLWNRNNNSGGNSSISRNQRRRRKGPGSGSSSQIQTSQKRRQPPIPGHNVESVTLGTLMLWFGWYGFNVAPAYLRGGALLSNRTSVAVRAAVNTTLAACASGLSALGLGSYFSDPKAIDLRTACNGVLGGIVAATALCAYVEPWAAVVVGALAGAALVLSTWLLEKMGVDDPLDSVSVHGSCALVGLLGAAFLAKPQYLEAYRGTQLNSECGGLFYLKFGRRGWEQLGIQLAGVAAISALSFSLSALVFFGMRAGGVLRVDTATEIAGIDHVDHGGPAYPDFELKTRE